MVCSICKQVGHNRTTCSRRLGDCPANRPRHVCPVAGNPKAVKASKRSFGGMKPISRDEAEKKLKMIRVERKEQYDMANACVESLNQDKNCSIRAEEKTGKRVIMELIHLILLVNHGLNVRPEKNTPRSVYVTALNRKDTKDQFREQEEEFGIFSIVATKQASLLVDAIIEILNDPTVDGIIYIHLDECDYGTGSDQSLCKLYLAPELNTSIHKNRIKYVTYSATPEELDFSSTIDGMGWDKHVFIPSKDYLGAQWYLDNNLVFKPELFFDGESDFTDQGKMIIEEVQNSCSAAGGETAEERMRNVIVVRDTGKGNLNKIRERKEYFEDEYSCEIRIVDQSTAFGWGDPYSWVELGTRERLDDNMFVTDYDHKPVLIFISQTCTRSTELCPLGHRKIAVWHDARKLEDKKAYNTISQAIGRIKHYLQKGHPVNRIKLYCDEDVLNKTVGNKLNSKTLVLSQRITTKSSKDTIHEFVGYSDDLPVDVSKVPDADWQQEQEEKPECGHSKVNGQWCLYDQTKPYVRYWGDSSRKETRPVGYRTEPGTHRQTTIEYESKSSNRYIIRQVTWKVSLVPQGEVMFEHGTKKSSMWW